ncbi:hypothetical protein M513_09176 [Trichuris suis]|uniref:Transcription factor CBF/NF-Y/archaeal histone domain-containing protein n=1 Tax=Trichuris suis TaxID=68888 RepID=A0A085LYB6_9BILA|nr:hypothetical protein M513_09176 [Trichuris suis]
MVDAQKHPAILLQNVNQDNVSYRTCRSLERYGRTFSDSLIVPKMGLPPSKVKQIMAMASDSVRISNEAAEGMAKAAELFIKDLVSQVAAKMPADRRNMKVEHLENLINTNPKYAFIGDALKTFPCEEFLCLTPSVQSTAAEEDESNIGDIEDMLEEQCAQTVDRWRFMLHIPTDLADNDLQANDNTSADSASSN